MTPMLKEMQFALKCVITCYQRGYKLSRTDFYVQPDYPSDPEGLEAVKTYRQALRDVPEQSGFPRDVQWPEMPAVLSAKKSKLGLAKVGI